MVPQATGALHPFPTLPVVTPTSQSYLVLSSGPHPLFISSSANTAPAHMAFLGLTPATPALSHTILPGLGCKAYLVLVTASLPGLWSVPAIPSTASRSDFFLACLCPPHCSPTHLHLNSLKYPFTFYTAFIFPSYENVNFKGLDILTRWLMFQGLPDVHKTCAS